MAMNWVRKIGLVIALTTVAGLGGRLLAQTQVAPSAPWAHLDSDLPPDPAIRFGTLPNGMRYALRHNATPPKRIALRLRIDAGSLLERDDQRGLAHFMEHMAFNGTTNLPENELLQTLQRNGLSFGSDLNATTSFQETVYKLDLPTATDALTDSALHILREQVSEALMAPASIDEERGVVAGEARLKEGPELRAYETRFRLIAPRLADRLPIGDAEVIRTAPRERFVAFYEAYYRPSRTTLIAVGDFDLDVMEARIKRHFGDWTPRTREPASYVVPPSSRSSTAKVLTEAGSRRSAELIWTYAPDLRPDKSVVQREKMLRYFALAALGQRLEEISHGDDAPFTGAYPSGDELYKLVGTTSIKTFYLPGKLKDAIEVTEREQRRFLQFGMTEVELARQVADARRGLESEVAGAATQSTSRLADSIAYDVNERTVTSSPKDRLSWFERNVKGLKAADVNPAIRSLFVGKSPVVFVTSPVPIPGGDATVARYLTDSRAVAVTAPPKQLNRAWPYTDFGFPGTVVARREDKELGATVITFANGTLLTVKPTKFTDDEVLVSISTGLGKLAVRRDRSDPLNFAQVYMVDGGLGKLTRDDLSRVLVGRRYSVAGIVDDDRFRWTGTTRSKDLQLQMQVLAAYITDPGLRAAPLEQEKATFASSVAQFRSTARGAWQVDSKELLADGDKREAVPSEQDIAAASTRTDGPLLRRALSAGPVHVIIVGDIELEQAIAATATTLGALARRGVLPAPVPGSNERHFPAGNGDIVRLHHTGSQEQALAFIAWPGPDAVDDNRERYRAAVLTFVLNLRVLQEIRERQALAYSPTALLRNSTVFRGYGYVGVQAEVKPDKVQAFFEAVNGIVQDLKTKPVSQDELDRAQRPLVQQLRAAIQTNAYWADVLRDVDTKPERAQQIIKTIEVVESVSVSDVQALANRYFQPSLAWRSSVTPQKQP